MRLAVDTHVHLYPSYEIESALRRGWENLAAAAGSRGADDPPAGGAEGEATIPAATLLLAESRDHRLFEAARRGELLPSGSGLDLRPGADPEVVVVTGPSGDRILYLVAGRQIVTGERLELLALATRAEFDDGAPLDETLRRAGDAGAIPVLPWSPGKWTLRRGRTVRRTVRDAGPSELLLGDTTLRPRGWPEPAALRRARSRGLGIVAGSDPLPIPGEERLIGTYGVVLDLPDLPGPALRAGEGLVAALGGRLLDSGREIETIGGRPGVLAVLRRWLAHRIASARGR